MYVSSDMLDMLKTDTKRLFKETVDKLKNDFPAGSYLVFKSKTMVEGPAHFKFNFRK